MNVSARDREVDSLPSDVFGGFFGIQDSDDSRELHSQRNGQQRVEMAAVADH
jgi:hypothetical protein